MSSRALVAIEPDFRAVLGAGSKSFAFASQFLPPEDRLDAAVVYTFCRLADDAADEAPHLVAAQEALIRLEDELKGVCEAGPEVAAFLEVAGRRGIDLKHAQELLAGVSSDLGVVRVQDDVELIRYGYRVAGTVGLLMCPVIGVTDHLAYPFAVDLGLGMQLTNICRDVAEDARRNRVYLPASRLEAVGLTPELLVRNEVVTNLAYRRALAQVVTEIMTLADRYYASGDNGMRFIPWRPRVAIAVAARVYQAIGQKLVARGSDPLRGRTVVGRLGKLLSIFVGIYSLVSMSWSRSSSSEHQAVLHAPLAGLPGANPSASSELTWEPCLREVQS